ncbi:MAG: glycosyltransferase [Actinobacteria bacterium]|nr:glycosyltransferase [Actinomycetota bacterium]MBU1942361.1 glycosyltransferase [Actinomycetota bacterium]MBU2686355.1 glycosyltransferase [Actinomycetota bacterium]
MSVIAISVVIPTYDPGAAIDSCLDALEAQDPGVAFEVVVVDSGSDGTAERLAGWPGVAVVRCDRRLFPGTGRNLGVERSTGPLICFTDADCVPSADWLRNIWAARPDEHGTVLGGPILNGTPESLVGTAEYLSEMSGFMEGPARCVDFFPTANLALGRDVFQQVGGFEDLEKGSDVVFGAACRSAGVRLVFDPRVTVRHNNRTSMGRFLRNQERLGLGAGTNRVLHDMKGSAVARNPVAWPLVPAARFARTTARVMRNRGARMEFLKVSPLVMLGGLAYGLGFARGAYGALRRSVTC